MSKQFYLRRKQGKAVSSINIRIKAEKKIDEYVALYQEEHPDNESDCETLTSTTCDRIYRLDRKDRDHEVQDACQIYEPALKFLFAKKCSRTGIPTFAMTYLMDQIAAGYPEISLRNHGIGPTGIVSVVDQLMANRTVKKLDLSQNDILAEGTITVVKLLRRNQTITDLNISENNIGKKGMEAISNWLVNNGSIKRLNLSRNNLTSDDIVFFSTVMEADNVIEVLDLSHNKFDRNAGAHLGTMIRSNTSLGKLCFGWNYLGDEGVIEISKAMKSNGSLEKLDLCWNEIGDVSTNEISQALRLNNCLGELDLSHNLISDKGMENIAWGLESNSTLKTFRIGFNLFSTVGACCLLRSLLKNLRTKLEAVNFAEVESSTEFEELFWRLKLKKPRFNVLDMHSSSGDDCAFVLKPWDSLHVLETYLQNNNLNEFIDPNDKD